MRKETMSSRCLRKALRWSNGTADIIVGYGRTFTSSARCLKHGAVPAFSETSSPDLDRILAEFRTKVFLPAHLSKQQQDLIYKKNNEKYLQVETVTARISGEDFKLEHIDRVKDVPQTRKSLFAAVTLMKEKGDWDQAPVLLQGLKNAGIVLNSAWLKILVRKAAMAGRMDVMIECARRVDATGFRLKDPDLVSALMWGCQRKAIVSQFDTKETKKALAWAEMLVAMLEEDRHAGRRIAPDSDPQKRLEVVGGLLQLAAARAVPHPDSKDEDGLVRKYAEQVLVASLGQDAPLDTARITLGNSEVKEKASMRAMVVERNAWLRTTIPILHGMQVAQRVMGPNSQITKELKIKADTLRQAVNSQRSLLLQQDLHTKEKALLGLRMYDQLLGPTAPLA